MISVVIPVYKNHELFMRNLKHNLPFLRDGEILVVNDDPKGNFRKAVGSVLPKAIYLENSKNLGFGEAVNRGVQKAKGDYIILLNSDVILHDTTYIRALQHFNHDKNLFAVSFAQREKDGSIVGKNKLYWQRGFMHHSKAEDLAFGETGWAEGGACIIDRQKFLKLGGFDALYAPFYWEDIDLSFRAKKAGYKVIFDPMIVVEHHHESTIAKYFSKDYIEIIAYRNQWLFVWKNIKDRTLLLDHLLYLFPHLLAFMKKGEWNGVKGFFQALKLGHN